MCHHTTQFLASFICIQALTLSFLSVQQIFDSLCLHLFAPPPSSRGSMGEMEHGERRGGGGLNGDYPS